MIEYKIVTAENTDALENKVADLIDLGFRPLAGLCVAEYAGRYIWGQAMIRHPACEAMIAAAEAKSVAKESLVDLEKE